MTEDPSLGWAAIDWIEHYLVHGPGDVQGQPIELDDEFAAFIVKAYRVHPETGARRVRRAFLSRAKGRSKSGLAAFIEDFEALGPCRFDHWAEEGEISDWGYEYEPGEPVGRPLDYVEILNVATEESQAGNTYDAVYYTLHPDTCSEALLEDYGRIDAGLTRINLPNSRGFIEPVTASNESKDGGKSTFIVADETHLWIPPQSGKFKLGKMHQTMVRNLLKRKLASGWMLETSTMYAAGEESVAEGTHRYAEQMKTAGNADGKLLFDHRQASDKWNLDDRKQRLKALRESYGPAAEWMDLDAIADYWDDPQATHREFRRFWLNQPVPIDEPHQGAFDQAAWIACQGTWRVGQMKIVALSLAVSYARDWATVMVAARDGDAIAVRPIARDRGTAWVPAKLKALQGQIGLPVIVDPKSPADALIPVLEREDVELRTLSTDEAMTACATADALVNEGRLRHESYPELEEGVKHGQRREMRTTGRFLWERKSGIDTSALEAMTLATWQADNPIEEEPPPEPFFLLGS